MSKHPLIEAMGLTLQYGTISKVEVTDSAMMGLRQPVTYVTANELERVLEQAPVVYATMGKPSESIWSSFQTDAEKVRDTHTARLLCIQPVKAPDTAESLLREILRAAGQFPQNVPPGQRDWLERARKLLEATASYWRGK